MELAELSLLGLTKGEIAVYESLLQLGQTTTGNIMKKSKISSSKVYLILDKLIDKGLVSFVVINSVKHFQATSPGAIFEYIDSKKKELEESKGHLKELISKIKMMKIQKEEESAQVYKGIRGIKTAYTNLLDELNKGVEYYVFTISEEESKNLEAIDFFKKFHLVRYDKGIKLKAIADFSVKKLYQKEHILGKGSSIRFHPLTLPSGIAIGKSRVLFVTFDAEITAYEILSKSLAKKYRDYFISVWKRSKK